MTNTRTKFIHEGQYAAEVDIEVVEVEGEWAPYLSVQDAYKLDDIRAALQRGDIAAAAKLGKVYALTPVDV